MRPPSAHGPQGPWSSKGAGVEQVPLQLPAAGKKLRSVRADNFRKPLVKEVSDVTLAKEASAALKDAKSCTAAIAATQRQLQWWAALRLIRLTANSGSLRLNVISANAAVRSCDSAGQWAWALQLIAGFRHDGLDQDLFTWNTAMHACGRGREWAQALQLLRCAILEDEDRKKGAQRQNSLTISFNTLINACRSAARWEQALSLLGAMQQGSYQADAVSFNSAMSACAAACGAAGVVNAWASALF
ncbi:unnamed protein product [Polarella glacialis]|uniref:Pentatricopeptide repeat-containing protein, chloroplastic n=1 Tax=Polarella glacialis TaxID=89957 RepID=A0A813FWK0_POLGL|nr:unnamed protein product [Polarella glacialis]CAE8655924.1 unnamed protein product [Polarella glacialis]